MATLSIDNKSYDIEQLSDEAKAQVASLQYVEAELQRLGATIAVFQTARNAYLSVLRPLLASANGQEIKPQQH